MLAQTQSRDVHLDLGDAAGPGTGDICGPSQGMYVG